MLGIDQYTINKIEDEAAIYTDTDSIYVQFDSALDSIIGADFSKDEALNTVEGQKMLEKILALKTQLQEYDALMKVNTKTTNLSLYLSQ